MNEARTSIASRSRARRLAAGLFAAPLAFAVQLQTNYALVYWACESDSGFVLHLVSAAALAIGIAGTAVAFGLWREARRGNADDWTSHESFLAVAAVLISAFFLVVILAHEVPNLLLGPCT